MNPSDHPLREALQSPTASRDLSGVLDSFLSAIHRKSITLYPAQESAILELFEERNVILNTPTGSGKSLVASALHFLSLAQGRRSVYTCPVKALVNEKWLALCREFGPENVGLSTGDASVNRDAPILCCTAEVLSNMALRGGRDTPVHDIVMDEFHFYSDPARGVAWQIPLLTLPQARFLLMSATLGDTSFFEKELTQLTGKPTTCIHSVTRPVPLEFSYAETPLANTVEDLLASAKAPIYVVHFTQLEASKNAGDFMSLPIASKHEKAQIAEALQGFRFSSPYGPELKRWIKHGIGLHHAGLLPKYRLLIEQLAQRGLLKLICGTDTLGVGVNIPIRTVLFTQLCKFTGEKTSILSARDFHQIAGRAGRKGFDETGWVVAQAPAHVIENLQLEKKQAATGKRFVKRKPPERNFVPWERSTFDRLIVSPPEALKSHFEVTSGMLLNVLSRPYDGPQAMRDLIHNSHEPPAARKKHRRKAWQLFRSLLQRGIVEIHKNPASPARLSINADLQDDFSLNQTLSLYLHETLAFLDPATPDYALRVISLVESILEDPAPILRRQLDRLKTEAIAEMKAQGIAYEERLEQLESLEHPKPDRDFIYSTFNAFAEKHPWVGSENIRPKSIAREMFEEYRSFSDYIKLYELQRVEGLLLRHLSSVYKALTQTVPDSYKNPALSELATYLLQLLRDVDSSLLDQWQKMRNPGFDPKSDSIPSTPHQPNAPFLQDPTQDARQLQTLVRDKIFSFLRKILNRDFEGALQVCSANETSAPQTQETRWKVESSDALQRAWEPYFENRNRFRLDPAARNSLNTRIARDEDSGKIIIDQILVDPEEHNDWIARFQAPLEPLRNEGLLQLEFLGLEPADRLL